MVYAHKSISYWGYITCKICKKERKKKENYSIDNNFGRNLNSDNRNTKQSKSNQKEGFMSISTVTHIFIIFRWTDHYKYNNHKRMNVTKFKIK